jgi:hypothetical protein
MTTNNWVYNEEIKRIHRVGETYIININQRLAKNKTSNGCGVKNISNFKI